MKSLTQKGADDSFLSHGPPSPMNMELLYIVR